MTHRPRTFVLLLLLLVVAASGCGGGGREGAPARGADEASVGDASGEQLSGRIVADGSSTVGPFTTAAAERFQRQHSGVQITVGVSGTGGGFSRFCRGETDLSNASRPIKDEEAEQCEENGVEYVEFQIVNDGLSVVVNNENDWADCLTTDELRRIWRQFFTEHDHATVASASLIPTHPTAPLFTNSGMMQFVPYFLKEEEPPYKRAESIQKCVRLAGKHNDTDELGRTRRHLSFFEMLGNWSFGDYFKEDAIRWAWELVVNRVGFDGDRIWATVHLSLIHI